MPDIFHLLIFIRALHKVFMGCHHWLMLASLRADAIHLSFFFFLSNSTPCWFLLNWRVGFSTLTNRLNISLSFSFHYQIKRAGDWLQLYCTFTFASLKKIKIYLSDLGISWAIASGYIPEQLCQVIPYSGIPWFFYRFKSESAVEMQSVPSPFDYHVGIWFKYDLILTHLDHLWGPP